MLGKLEHSIQGQLAVNQTKNLFFFKTEQSLEVEPGFLKVLQTMVNQSEIPADEVFAFTVRSVLDRIYAVNPYLRIGVPKIAELEQIYRQTFSQMKRTNDLRATLREVHYPALVSWLKSLYPPEFLKSLCFAPSISGVVYEAYSARLQVALFQLNLSHIKPPVLDLGCGRRPHLVNYLHSSGIEVYGLDRHLETRAPYLEQADWFEYVFEAGQWGTIISNMAFTNHLNYAYRHDTSQFQAYLLKAKEIFASLTAGGSFYYAPGLPFIEERLQPAHFRVERKSVCGVFVSHVTKLQG